MKFNDLNNVEKEIFNRLFAYFNQNINPEEINILINDEYAKKKRITIYQTQFNSIIFTDISLYKEIKNEIDKINNNKISISELKAVLSDHSFTKDSDTHCLFLNPERFKKIDTPLDYQIKEINKNNKEQMIKLKKRCSKYDLEQAQVSLKDPYILGCFNKNELISVASYWYWGEGLADIGIITHPEYRKMGIGKAIISNLCEQGININRINLYRHDENNTVSRKLGLSLNFEEKMIIETCRII
ncbi:MAG: GNAT family N-acetyltransferase [Halanaerobiales bacterium]|nr:GNAT family N-acetyltransferase [Halanaerobiales bacterium]